MTKEVKYYSFLFWFWNSSSARATATAITCSWRFQTVKAPATFLQLWPDKSINSRGHEINCRGNERLDRICSYISPRITLCLFLLSNPLCTCSIGRGKAARAKHLLESVAHISNTHLESQCQSLPLLWVSQFSFENTVRWIDSVYSFQFCVPPTGDVTNESIID